ncbi:gp53-like domain-containing protein [Yersinia sp. 1252 StPb PI]|uniref:gp53-like domain-containing protein n=1 Tax=Yersinia sp. 1252 StPb PI TaxID=3117404 RepID=UPI003B2868E2
MSDHVQTENPHAQYLMIDKLLSEIKAAGPAAIAQTLLNLGLGEASKQGVATNAQMATGTAKNLLPSVAAVMSMFSKRSFSENDFIRFPDVPGGLILQWASVTSGSGGDATWIYPTPFPTARLAILGTFKRLGVVGADYPTISFNNISDQTPLTLSNLHLRLNGTAGPYSAFVIALGH